MRVVQKLGLNSYYSTISLNRATMLKEILFDLRGLQDLIQEKIVELETKDLKMSVRRVERNAQLGDRPVANTAWSDEDDEVIEQDAWADEDKFVEHCENGTALAGAVSVDPAQPSRVGDCQSRNIACHGCCH